MTSDQFVIKSDKEPLLPRATMKGLLVFIVVIAAVAAGPVHKVRQVTPGSLTIAVINNLRKAYLIYVITF